MNRASLDEAIGELCWAIEYHWPDRRHRQPYSRRAKIRSLVRAIRILRAVRDDGARLFYFQDGVGCAVDA